MSSTNCQIARPNLGIASHLAIKSTAPGISPVGRNDIIEIASAVSYGRLLKLEAQLRAEVEELMALGEKADQGELPDGLDIEVEVAFRQERLVNLAQAKAGRKPLGSYPETWTDLEPIRITVGRHPHVARRRIGMHRLQGYSDRHLGYEDRAIAYGFLMRRIPQQDTKMASRWKTRFSGRNVGNNEFPNATALTLHRLA